MRGAFVLQRNVVSLSLSFSHAKARKVICIISMHTQGAAEERLSVPGYASQVQSRTLNPYELPRHCYHIVIIMYRKCLCNTRHVLAVLLYALQYTTLSVTRVLALSTFSGDALRNFRVSNLACHMSLNSR